MKVFIKILKIIAGIILGLVFSFLTIVCLDAILSSPNSFGKYTLNLWLVTPIVAVWVFFMLWLLLLRKPSAKKIQTQGFEHLPESISELIDGIIDAMKYRRSVRVDVRQELADHFTDALADCEGEQEKQERIKELIAEFGDVELLGQLLRRAKKRCRPLWRTMLVRTFQLIGICFLLLIVYIGWFFTGKPVITTDYLEVMNQMVRPVADDSQNAWPFYKQAAEKYVKYEDEKFDFHIRNASTRSEEDRQIIQQAISDNQESLELIRQGNQKPYYWQIYGTGENEDKEMLTMLMPHLSDYRKMVYLMCWQGLLNAEQGDFEKTFGDLFEVYLFGQHLRGQNTTLIEQLVAMSIEAMSTETLRMVLAEYSGQINVQVLDSARKRFAAVIENKDFTIDFGGEKLFMRDEVQRSFTQSRFGKSHLYLPRLRVLADFDADTELIFLMSAKALHVLFTHPDKEQTLKEVEQWYSEMEKMSTLTPASVKSQDLSMEETTNEAIERNLFLNILLPALGKISQISYRNRAKTHATLVILGVMQYEKERGKLPELLDDLIEKGLLNEIPKDPFSDEPLVYRKTDDGFTIYSVGLNFIDDGGVLGTDSRGKHRNWGENGDAIFWPVESVTSQQLTVTSD